MWGPELLLMPSTSWDEGLSAPLTSASHWHDEIPGSWQTEVLPRFMGLCCLPGLQPDIICPSGALGTVDVMQPLCFPACASSSSSHPRASQGWITAN